MRFIVNNLAMTVVVLLCILVLCAAASTKPAELTLSTRHKFTPKKGTESVFCYWGTGNTSEPTYLFNEVLIHVNETSNHKLPWYSVKGVSTDDLHSHLEDFVYYVMGQLGVENAREIKAPHEIDSYLRDVVSACPNPVFSKSRSHCIMRFSTIGHACVKVALPQDYTEHLNLTVYVEERMNMNFVYSFLVGLSLFFVAGYLGYNMVFQYTAGAVVFVCGAALAVTLLALKCIVRANSSSSKFVRNLIIALLLSGVYLSAAVWYLRTHWHQLILHYWEYVLGYVAVTAVAGIVAVQIVRNDAQSRHRLAVAVKWVIRTIAVVVLYNSTASPFGSLTLLSLTVLLYATYAMYKPRNVFLAGEMLGDEHAGEVAAVKSGKEESKKSK